MTQYRKGDIVLIEATVRHVADSSGKLHLRIESTYLDVYMDQEEVSLLRPFFDIGEQVWISGIPIHGATVKAKDGELIWVQLANGDYQTVLASALTPVEKPPEPVVEDVEAAPAPEVAAYAAPADVAVEVQF